MLKVVGASWDQTRISSMILGAVGILGILAFIVGEIERAEDDGYYSATVFWSESTGYKIEFWGQGNNLKEIKLGVARAYFKPDIENTGWAMLEVQTDAHYRDDVQAYAAGLLEGSLSWQMIYWHWINTVQDACEDREEYCNNVRRFLQDNDEWVRRTAEERQRQSDFWHQIHLFYKQLDGIEAGWRHGVMRGLHDVYIPPEDFLWMNIVSDLTDLELKFNGSFHETQSPLAFSAASSLSTAFVKLLPDTKEIFVAHNSAGLYRSMLKMLKSYQLNYHLTSAPDSALIPGRTIVFSSYPGSIHSQDDFYQISGQGRHQLAVTGTGITNYNRTLWDRINAREQVLLGPRAMASNRLASNGKAWSQVMAAGHCGTGNKQWLVVDPTRLAGDGKKGLLWVVEQMPGETHSSDHSNVLWSGGFWASHGLPFHQDILKCSGTLAMERRYGPSFSTENSPLTQIFRREQVNATSIPLIQRLMRANRFLEDPVSLGSPLHATAGRGDLPGMARSVAHPVLRPLGATDFKVIHYFSNQNQMQVVAGPTSTNGANNTKNQIPPFKWSSSHFNTETHVGQPDLWDFDPLNPLWFWK